MKANQHRLVRAIFYIVISAIAGILASCATFRPVPPAATPPPAATAPPSAPASQPMSTAAPIPQAKPRQELSPASKTQEVKASWYGHTLAGHKTASGKPYNSEGLTAASKTLPMGTIVKVSNPRNGKSVKVQINDRGPFVRGRSLDLSHHAAKALGMLHTGVTRVKVQKLTPHLASRSDARSHELTSNERRKQATETESSTISDPTSDPIQPSSGKLSEPE